MDAADSTYRFQWNIEKYSYAPRVPLSWIQSPYFPAEEFERTSWCLKLNPLYFSEKGHSSLLVQRSADDAGPETLSVNLDVSIITVNGSTLYSEQRKHTFPKGEACLFKAFLDMDELYVRKNIDFLPRDTVVVRCSLRRGEGTAQTIKQHTARTLIAIENFLVLHKVENFSILDKNEKKVLKTPSRLNSKYTFNSTLRINAEKSANGSISVGADSNCIDHRIRRKGLYVVVVNGNTYKIGEVAYRFTDCDETEKKIDKLLTRDFILKNKTAFLPKDELTLLCECTFYIGLDHSKIDEVEIPKEIGKDECCNTHENNDCKGAEDSAVSTSPEDAKLKKSSKKSLPVYPTALDGFKELYTEQLLTDIQLKTATKSFLAHKNVLCARSPFFRSQFLSHDVKKRNIDCIKVDDLEDETLHQLLLFLYSDSLENLGWESALKLCYAADKYELKSLKILCSSFLVDNLSTSNASQLLILADRHSDAELKESVIDFIHIHETDVFSSDEWKDLAKTHPQLVIETMLLKYNRPS